MNPIALIPARGGSKEIPRKNIMDFCGKPLIAWSIEQAKNAGLEPWVSTEDEEIMEIAAEYGAHIDIRPKYLADDSTPMIEVVKRFSMNLKEAKGFDTIVLLQPTNPLRTNGLITTYMGIYERKKYDLMVSCYKNKHPIYNGEVNNINRQDRNCINEHGLIYIYNTICLERPVNKGCFVTPEWMSNEIDCPDDVYICEFLMRRNILCTM